MIAKKLIFTLEKSYYTLWLNKKNVLIREILEKNWANYGTDLHPRDRRMNILAEKGVDGMSTENVRFLFNEIVRQSARNGAYLEVGMYRGCSLLSAALFNPSTRCIGIDNFSEFGKEGENEGLLNENLRKFRNPKNTEYYDVDYREGIKKIFSNEPNLKINIFFYDAQHSYENQTEGLRMMLPHLAENCIIIVDDFNWKQVERANADFIKENPAFKSIFKIKTESNCSKDWWNGIEVIARGV